MGSQEFELLAPAGSFQTFQAVIEAGADAVYVGGSQFGARAYAENFTQEELLAAIDYAHLRGKKVYLTINTLLKNEEIEKQLYHYLLPYYERGLDAVLVQDFGTLQFIHNNFPRLPIHTSTQMTITGIEGVRYVQQFGVTRVVMAREVSLEEMKEIHEQTGMELEAFVHGALCYCYSGQCLLSSMLGGRSGNRGRCAQPCRLPYAVLDENQKEYRSDSYVLSLKDLCGVKDIPTLYNSGVFSLKIEGRMKQTEYAAGVVSFYRKAIDQFFINRNSRFEVLNQDYKSLLDLGNRCGFTNSYYYKHNDPSMVTFVKPNYATDNEQLHKEVAKRYIASRTQIPIRGYLYLRKGEEALLTVSCDEYSVSKSGIIVSEAKSKPVTEDDLDKRMRKTGDTAFAFEELVIDMEDGIFLPNGAVNQLRREALDDLETLMLKKHYRQLTTQKVLTKSNSISQRVDNEGEKRNIASVEMRCQLDAVLQCEWITTVYIDWNTYNRKRLTDDLKEDSSTVSAAGKECFLILPAISRNETMKFLYSIVNTLQNIGLQGFVVKTYEELYFVKKYFPQKEFIIDHNLYSYNDWAVSGFLSEGAKRVTVPLELNRKELIRRDNSESEMLVYGYYPLMTTAQCVHSNTKHCDRNPKKCYLKDRYQKKFPVKNHCNECYNTLYNSVPILLLSHMEELQSFGINAFRWSFTIESPEEIKSIFDIFDIGEVNPAMEYTKGHYKRGVE